MRFAKPTHEKGEEVLLVRDKGFVKFDRWGRHQRKLPKGTIVKVEQAERLTDDHGRFSRYWYHLTFGMGFAAIAEEDEITKSTVLDRLAIIKDDS